MFILEGCRGKEEAKQPVACRLISHTILFHFLLALVMAIKHTKLISDSRLWYGKTIYTLKCKEILLIRYLLSLISTYHVSASKSKEP